MRSLPWFRLYTEARVDAKLRTLQDDEHRVWFQLLCFAAEQPSRGNIPGMPEIVLAAEVAAGNTELLRRTITKLVNLRILSDGGADGITVVHFRDRQHDYPSDRPEETRKRKQAHRSRVVTSVSRGVTTQDIEVREKARSRKDQDRDKGGESERGDVNSPAAPETPAVAKPSTKTVVVELTPGQRERLRQDFAALGEGFDDYLGEALSYYTPLIIKGKHSNLYACARKSLRSALDRRTNGTNRGHPQGPQKPSKFDGFGITVEG